MKDICSELYEIFKALKPYVDKLEKLSEEAKNIDFHLYDSLDIVATNLDTVVKDIHEIYMVCEFYKEQFSEV